MKTALACAADTTASMGASTSPSSEPDLHLVRRTSRLTYLLAFGTYGGKVKMMRTALCGFGKRAGAGSRYVQAYCAVRG